jgi:two-component system, chemotaxis family, sensor kinase CheA
MSEMNAIVLEFVQEGTEKIDLVEHHIIELEKSPNSRELVNEVFRVLHSIKGATSFLGFTKLCALTHAGETLLARLREGKVAVTPQITSALLDVVDAVRRALSEIETTGQESNTSYTGLVDTLTRLGKSN